MFKIGNDWDEILGEEVKKDYYQKLKTFLVNEYKEHRIYPDMKSVFTALKNTNFFDTKVVIIGQDPYYCEGQAHGLCFSVQEGTPCPPSLKNIYKEIFSDLGIAEPNCGDLTRWARQGVLLLNTVLTVREFVPNSHRNKGWETFTDFIIKSLNEREKPVVFLLWGANARQKASLVTNSQHLILQCAHPSPLSAYNGFFGCKHFSKTNNFLRSIGETEIDW